VRQRWWVTRVFTVFLYRGSKTTCPTGMLEEHENRDQSSIPSHLTIMDLARVENPYILLTDPGGRSNV